MSVRRVLLQPSLDRGQSLAATACEGRWRCWCQFKANTRVASDGGVKLKSDGAAAIADSEALAKGGNQLAIAEDSAEDVEEELDIEEATLKALQARNAKAKAKAKAYKRPSAAVQAKKPHQMLHFAQHLEQFTTLLSCFVTERKHRAVKAYANDIKNTIMFDESILSEVTCAHLARMNDPDVFSTRIGLIQPRMPTPKLARLVYEALDLDVNTRYHVLIGKESSFNKFGTCAINDVVAMQFGTALQIGQVRFHFEVEGEPVSIISTWDDLNPDEHGSCVCKPSGRHITIETSDNLETLIWKMTSNSKVRVLLPQHLLHAP
jgi:hypothetical protein